MAKNTTSSAVNGQRLLEGVSELVLLDDAIEGRLQHDDHQADQTHLGPVHGQADNQDNSHDGLYRQARVGTTVALGFIRLGLELLQHQAHGFRQLGAVAELAA
jgi:hypothetical protein